jgi:hypothetical protein
MTALTAIAVEGWPQLIGMLWTAERAFGSFFTDGAYRASSVTDSQSDGTAWFNSREMCLLEGSVEVP